MFLFYNKRWIYVKKVLIFKTKIKGSGGNNLIEVSNLTKKYGQNVAVDNISFTVSEGEIVGFLGPNGAGKSTTMNMITGYISSTQGSVKINGFDILEQPEEAKKRIGYLPELPPLYMDMTVEEYLDFVADLNTIKRADKAKVVASVMETTQITHMKKRLIKNLSKGYKQRVGLSQALIGNPDVLILDEPTVGLDPNQIIEMRDVIKNLGKKHTIMLSSHILSEVSAVCDRVIIISKGKIVASDTPENLSKRLTQSNRLTVRVKGPKAEVVALLNAIENVDKAYFQTSREKDTVDILVEGKEDTDIREEVFKVLTSKNYPILSMTSMDLTLEEIFLEVTKDGKGGK
jgi:ABC-2 type transport system ATP-binding protein